MREDDAHRIYSSVFYSVRDAIVAELDAALREYQAVAERATRISTMHKGLLMKDLVSDDEAAIEEACAYADGKIETIKAIKAKFKALDSNKHQKDLVQRLAWDRFQADHPRETDFVNAVASRKRALDDACRALDPKYGPHRPFVSTEAKPMVILGPISIGDGKYERLEADIDEPGQCEGLFLIEADRIPFGSGCVNLSRDEHDYDTVRCDDQNLRITRAQGNSVSVPPEGTLERLLLDDFIGVLEACKAPRSKWQEDIITAALVDAIERRAEDLILYPDAQAAIDYGVFKQSGTPEQKHGDICLIVGTNDGTEKKAYVCYIEAKKVHDVKKCIRSIRQSQLDRIKNSGVPTYILIYDLWVPPLWQMAIMPIGDYLEQRSLQHPNVTEIGKPLSWQLVHRFLRGEGMADTETALRDAAVAAHSFASHIVYVRRGFGHDYTIAQDLCYQLPDRWERMLEIALHAITLEREQVERQSYDLGDDFDYDISDNIEHVLDDRDISDDFRQGYRGRDISDDLGRGGGMSR